MVSAFHRPLPKYAFDKLSVCNYDGKEEVTMKDPKNPPSGPGDPTISIHGDEPDHSQVSEATEIKARFGRYQLSTRIGSGGMGEVYKAYDPTLDRWVALKILYPGDPRRIARFFQEARAQARVKHPHICPVFEVGEEKGRPYIAMQYIEGKTLDEMAKELPREALLRIIYKVAMALHSAHMQGLIHRDIKPSNIMVESSEDGDWRPYLLDFGLARDLSALSTTQTGAILGTPHFMAPEQAQGRIQEIDRRTDVWGLGATLYALLTGNPPFDGATSFEVLQQVVHSDPVPLRKIRPEIPKDLETIVMTCLEKDPHRRYPSARDFAEDIERFLRGDPIKARPVSLVTRWKLKIRKYPVASAAIASALIITLISAGWVLRTRWELHRQALLAQQFGQTVERIESLWRIITMLPRHPVQRDIQRIQSHMMTLQQMIRELGPSARAPGAYAVGRGFLTLGKLDEAWKYLTRAWEDGYQTPDTALALGLTGTEIYRDKLYRLSQIRTEEEQRDFRKQLILQWKLPILDYLREGQNSLIQSPQYVKALLYFVEGQYEPAYTMAEKAYQRYPWLYEARVLQADIRSIQAQNLSESGRVDLARRHFNEAIQIIESASRIAPSSPELHRTWCRIYERYLSMEVYTGGDATSLYREGKKTCELGLIIQPHDSVFHHLIATLHWRMGEYALYHDIEVEPYLKLARKHIDQAMQFDPDNSDILNNRGIINLISADWAISHGINPDTYLDNAQKSFEKSLTVEPNNTGALFGLGNTWLTRTEWAMNHGENAEPMIMNAVKAFEAVLQKQPYHIGALNNLGISYEYHAQVSMEKGKDPEPYLQKAIDVYSRILVHNPTDSLTMTNLGNVYTRLAIYRMKHGKDPVQAFESAIEVQTKACELSPQDPLPWNNLAYVWKTWGEYLLQNRQNPLPLLTRARQAARKALNIHPGFLDSLINMSETYLLEAEYRIRLHQDPKSRLERSKEYLYKARSINPELPSLDDLEGRLLRLFAMSTPDNNKKSEFLKMAIASFRKALSKDPMDPSLYTHLAETLVDLAKVSCPPEKSCPHLSRALDIIEDGLERNPYDARSHAIKALILFTMTKHTPSLSFENTYTDAQQHLMKAFEINDDLKKEFGYLAQRIQHAISDLHEKSDIN